MKRKKLSADFLKANHVFFHPRTRGEAEYIQKRLFEMGVRWKDAGYTIVHDDKMLAEGMNVDNRGMIYLGEDRTKPYITAAARDFPGFDPMDIMTTQEHVIALRRELAEVHHKLDRVLAHLEPSLASKRVIARKAGGGMS